MSKENKAFVRTFLDAFAGGDVETTKAMMADDHVFHFPFVDEPMDKQTHAATQAGLAAAPPDLKIEVHDQIAEGDKVATRIIFSRSFLRRSRGWNQMVRCWSSLASTSGALWTVRMWKSGTPSIPWHSWPRWVLSTVPIKQQ